MRKTDNLTTFMCRLSGNSGSLNLLEPSGPVQACNGIALPFDIYIFTYLLARLLTYLLTYLHTYVKDVEGRDRGPFRCSIPTHSLCLV